MTLARLGILFVFGLGSVPAVSAAEPAPVAPPPAVKSPLSVDEALKSFVLASPDLKMELVAGEPDVIAPVAIAFGDDLALWVVEMRDYPYGPKAGSNEKPKSRIKRLLDLNKDGRYETASVFADELLFATGVLPWKDGLIVTLAGEIAFFADRDGDGKAEVRETWFTGFDQGNSQLRANHPTLGPDGWVYVANGLRGGTVVAAKPEWKAKGQPLPLAGFDFRFHPLTGEYGAVSGHGQFGLCFDDYGNRFVCSNRNPVQHIVLEDHFVKRNPFLAVKKTVHDVAAFAEHSKLHPISRTWTTSLLHDHQFTAACGVQIYRGDALPPEYKGNAFTCDPTGNLIHREVMTPQGATFTSHPGEQGQEFLASPDSWFRPVNIANGPDGALYVVDMYRAVIEHPDWMPVELRTRKDLNDGSDRGRIWRVVPVEPTPLQERPDGPLGKLALGDQIELLEHRNAWHRETASRLLLERHPDEVLDALKLDWKKNRLTRSRLHVLWLLKALDPRLTPAILAWSETENRDARVREQVVAAIGENLDELLSDGTDDLASHETDDRVRFRLALDLTGRSADDHQARASLVRLLRRGAADPWLRVAVGTMKTDPPEAFLIELLTDWETLAEPVAAADELVEELSAIIGRQIAPAASRPIFKGLLGFHAAKWDAAVVRDIRLAGLRGMADGIARHGQSLQEHLAQLGETESKAASELIESARASLLSAEEAGPRRLTAIKTLQFVKRPEIAASLVELATSQTDASLRLAALDALATHRDPSVGPKLLAAFTSQTPPLRRAMLDVLLAEETASDWLLKDLESGTIKPNELDASRQARLMKHRNKELAARAEKLFAGNVSPDRAAVVTAYQPALEKKGDVTRGRAVFEKNCVTCHRVAGIGVNVGPDVADTYNKTPAYLLTNILDPNRAVDANYFGYTLATTNGKIHTGLVKTETASSITIRLPEGKEETILRADVEELKSSGLSLMPVGVEKNITVDQMADLIAFLKNWRYLQDAVPLGE
ncbi:MAG: PVC-type heme-binding CxxCH protein [Planctomycetota bacterium]